jgi:dienelactone hydrolase
MQRVRVEGLAAELQSPAGDGPSPAVIVLHEAVGLNADIRRIGRRFVDAGYAVLAPDLFSGGPRPLCIARTVTDALRNGGRETAGRIGGLRDWLAARPDVDGNRIGVVGFCMSGGFALAAGASHRFAVSGVNYGQVPQDRSALETTCPVVASFGAEDRRPAAPRRAPGALAHRARDRPRRACVPGRGPRLCEPVGAGVRRRPGPRRGPCGGGRPRTPGGGCSPFSASRLHPAPASGAPAAEGRA